MPKKDYWFNTYNQDTLPIEAPKTHIQAVIEDPFKFFLTPRMIEAFYKTHGEEIGVEGLATSGIENKIFRETPWVKIQRIKNKRISWKISCQESQCFLKVLKFMKTIDDFDPDLDIIELCGLTSQFCGTATNIMQETTDDS